MAEQNPRTSADHGEGPITAALPTVAAQQQEMSSSEPASVRQEKVKVPAQLKVLIVAAFVIALGFGLIAPVLPRYAASFDVGAMAASAVVSMFAVARLAFAPSSGKLVGKFGERPTYIVGLIIVALSSLATAFAVSYPTLLVARAIGGIGSVMFTVSAMGLLVRHSPPSIRGRISGYYATSFLLGNILGPVAGSAMAGLGMRLPFIIYGIALFIAAAVVFIFLEDSSEGSTSTSASRPQLQFREAWRFTNYRSALTTNFAMGWVALGLRVSLMPLAAVALLASYHAGENYDANAGGTVLAGLALALYAAGNALSQNISGALSDRFGRRRLIFTGLLIAGTATLLVGYAPSPVLFTVFSALTGIGTGFLAPSLQASVADIIGNSRNGGQVLAYFQMASDVGQIIGPILAGFIADQFGYGHAFALSAVFMLVCTLGWRPWRNPRFPRELADDGYTGK